MLRVWYTCALNAVKPRSLLPVGHTRLTVLVVMPCRVIADGVKHLVVALDKKFRTASIVCVEQASYERNDRVDPQKRES